MATVVWGDSYSTVWTVEQGAFASSATKPVKKQGTSSLSKICIWICSCPCMHYKIRNYVPNGIIQNISHQVSSFPAAYIPPGHHGCPIMCHRRCSKLCWCKLLLSPLLHLTHFSGEDHHGYNLLELDKDHTTHAMLLTNMRWHCNLFMC